MSSECFWEPCSIGYLCIFLFLVFFLPQKIWIPWVQGLSSPFFMFLFLLFVTVLSNKSTWWKENEFLSQHSFLRDFQFVIFKISSSEMQKKICLTKKCTQETTSLSLFCSLCKFQLFISWGVVLSVVGVLLKSMMMF